MTALLAVIQWAGCILVNVAAIVAIWWLGAISVFAKLWIAGLLGAAGALAVVPTLKARNDQNATGDRRWIWCQAVCILLWLLGAYVQTTELPRGLWGFVASGVAEIADEFADGNSRSTLSLVPEQTRLTLAWHCMLAAAFAVAALSFRSQRSRTMLLVVLTVNVFLICCWGIVQRSTGTSNPLPGVTNHVLGSNPFASFIYKNSGGAAVVMGIAALSGLLAWRAQWLSVHRSMSSGTGYSRSRHEPRSYNSSGTRGIAGRWSRTTLDNCLSIVTDPLMVLLGFGLALSLTGLASSLSRGAWIGLACGASIFIASFVWRHRGQSVSMIFVVLSILMALGLVVLFNNQQQVMVRVDMLDQEVIRRDDRWHHWQAATQAAAAYLPAGSGLGTYGYASLPFQNNTYDGWYKQAHNQYLETLVESGLLGLLLVTLFLTATGARVFQLLRSPRNSEAFVWGGVLCIAVVAISVQSMVDFVITTPANGLTFAVLLGAAVNVPVRAARSASSGSSQPAFGAKGLRGFRPSMRVGLASVLVGLVWLHGWSALAAARQSELALENTLLPPSAVVPTIESCDENILRLRSQTEATAGSAEVHVRLADWYTLKYRSELLQSYCAQSGQPPTLELWHATNLTRLFAQLQDLPSEEQGKARLALLTTPTLAESADSIRSELLRAQSANPMLPRVQLALAEQAPLAGVDYVPYLQHAYRLSGTSSELLYACGLLASLGGDIKTMKLCWSRALEMNPRRLPEITRLSLRWQDSLEIVKELYPASPAVLFAAYKRPDLPLSPEAREQSLERAEELLRTEADQLGMTEVERLQWLAKGAELKENWPLAISYYKKLIALEPRTAAIRFQYAQVLIHAGDFRTAWTQVHTGIAIDPSNEWAGRLLEQIERPRQL